MVAGLILLPKIFITDKELELFAELPIEESTTNLSSAVTKETLAVALTNPAKIKEYKKRYIASRKEERQKGKKGLIFLVIGSLFQTIGLILTSINSL